MATCGNCGMEIGAQDRFCGGCGAVHQPESVDAPPAPVAPPEAPQYQPPAPQPPAGYAPPAVPQYQPPAPQAPAGYAPPGAQPPAGFAGPAAAPPPGAPTYAPPGPPGTPAYGAAPAFAPPPEPAGGSKKGPLLAVVAAVAVLAVLAGAFVLLRDKNDDSSAAGTVGGYWSPRPEGPGSEPEELWKERIDCGDSCEVAVDADAVYAAEVDGDSIAVRAFKAGSGDEAWSEKVDGTYVDGLNVIDGVLLVDTSSDESSTLTALAGSDGKSLWDAEGSFSYIVGDGGIAVDNYDYSDESEDSSSTMSFVDLQSGDERWDGDGSSAGLCGDILYVNDGGDELVAREVGSGDEAWSESFDELSGTTCDNDGAYALAEGNVVALDPSSGDERWSETAADAYSLSVAGDVVIATGEADAEALAVSDGSSVWKQGKDTWAEDGGYPLPIGDGRALSVGDERAYLIDLKTGEAIEDISSGYGLYSGLGANVLVDLDNGDIEAFDPASLKRVWKTAVSDEAYSMALGGGRVVVWDDTEMVVYG